jgi:hypothetical protein
MHKALTERKRDDVQEIPGSGGLEVRVVAAGVVASTARTVIETPLELIKVRRQMGQTWKFNELYRGFNVTWIRTCGLMCTFFVLVRAASLLLHALLSLDVLVCGVDLTYSSSW